MDVPWGTQWYTLRGHALIQRDTTNFIAKKLPPHMAESRPKETTAAARNLPAAKKSKRARPLRPPIFRAGKLRAAAEPELFAFLGMKGALVAFDQL